jgi:hypothetical protein
MLQIMLISLRAKTLPKIKPIHALITALSIIIIVIVFNKPSMPEHLEAKMMFVNKHELFSQPKTNRFAGRDQIYRKNKTAIDSLTYNWFKNGKVSDGSYIDSKNDSINLKHVADNSSKLLARKSDIHDVINILIITG